MKKAIVFVLSLLCVTLSHSFASASESSISTQLELLRSEIEAPNQEKDKKKAKMRKTILKANISYLEKSMHNKIKHSESRLENYKIRLNNSENGEEVQYWLKKIEATEKKIKDLNEVLFGIETLKARIN